MIQELVPAIGLEQTLIVLGYNPSAIEHLINNVTIKS